LSSANLNIYLALDFRPAASLPIYGASGSGSPNPFASLEPFAMAASQAIAATQHFGGGRRGTM